MTRWRRRCGCWPRSEFGLGAGAAAAAPDSMVWSAAASASAASYGVDFETTRSNQH